MDSATRPKRLITNKWILLKSLSHQTRSYYMYVLNNEERAQTVWEWSRRSGNFLMSVTNFVVWIEREAAPERRHCSRISGSHPVVQLDGVTTYLTRYGRTTHGIAVLRLYKRQEKHWIYRARIYRSLGYIEHAAPPSSVHAAVELWCSLASLGSTFAHWPGQHDGHDIRHDDHNLHSYGSVERKWGLARTRWVSTAVWPGFGT